MKKIVSALLALILMLGLVLSFTSCGADLSGVYTDKNGNTWTFKSGKLEIDSTFKHAEVEHAITAVYSYDIELSDDKTVETLTLTLKKYVYEGDNAEAKEQVKEMNAYVDVRAAEDKQVSSVSQKTLTKEYTLTRADDGSYISLKSGTTITRLTVKQ